MFERLLIPAAPAWVNHAGLHQHPDREQVAALESLAGRLDD
ncbi:hypothetical protein [Kribbella shirazensis]|uniref:Uncharacterized protein n=1 Tax=Kribbella shirazensis TaxID=1105143 RepID=A0A7X6A3K5_9ACTN|nr:hypothetical protein [Kribbella shirazensis]NIK59434.1 hypothetical protein [Kribbella shirazensis]